MKKVLSLLLALFVCLTLAACGEDKTNNNGGMSKVESGAEDIINGTESTVSGAISGVESAIDGAMDGTTQSSKSNTSDKMTLTAKITAKEATAAALRHAGLKEENVRDIDVDLDRDNGRLIYEIDFNSNGTEYDYDVDAQTGDIISADKDRD